MLARTILLQVCEIYNNRLIYTAYIFAYNCYIIFTLTNRSAYAVLNNIYLKTLYVLLNDIYFICSNSISWNFIIYDFFQHNLFIVLLRNRTINLCFFTIMQSKFYSNKNVFVKITRIWQHFYNYQYNAQCL